ncbi:MAG: hypothetical protein ACOZAA_14175 [Pseudomonadota bacterium]
MKTAICAIAALGLSAAPLDPAFATEELDKLFADYWANELSENPFAATSVGSIRRAGRSGASTR